VGIVLGLCGIPGAGKTEVRKLLAKNHGFEVINSKSVLYSMSSQITGIPESHFFDPSRKNNHFRKVTLRQITGELGNAVENLFGDDYLIRKAMDNHKVASRPHKNFVIDSLRKQQPILLDDDLRVVVVQNLRAVSTGNKFDKFDIPVGMEHDVIQNNGDLDELERNVRSYVEYIQRHSND
jgi:dephospho-CoA kinase